MNVTIIDVAREAKVSISTVSKYLNGGKVREDNRIRIAQAIKKLKYFPSRAAQGLRTDRSHQIGLLISGLDSPYIANMTEDFVDFSHENGYHLLITSHSDDKKKAARGLSFLMQQQVDGIVYLPVPLESDYLKPALDHKIPLVAIDRLEQFPCDTVTCNSSVGSYSAVEHLIRNGHRKIAVIAGNQGVVSVAQDRLLGYLRAMEDYQIPTDPDYIRFGNFLFESGYQCMQELLDLKERPTAVFVTNYSMMLGAISALNNRQIRIPDDISFITFDDLDFSKMSSPQLTAVRQPSRAIVRDSIRLLIRRIEGDLTHSPLLIRNTPELIVRDSVKNLLWADD